VCVYAVGDGGKSVGDRELVEFGEELVLAEEAAIGLVRAVGGIFHFICFDEFVPNGQLVHELFHHGAIMGGKAGRERGND